MSIWTNRHFFRRRSPLDAMKRKKKKKDWKREPAKKAIKCEKVALPRSCLCLECRMSSLMCPCQWQKILKMLFWLFSHAEIVYHDVFYASKLISFQFRLLSLTGVVAWHSKRFQMRKKVQLFYDKRRLSSLSTSLTHSSISYQQSHRAAITTQYHEKKYFQHYSDENGNVS